MKHSKENSISLKTKIDYEIKELEKGLMEEEKELNHLIEVAKEIQYYWWVNGNTRRIYY